MKHLFLAAMLLGTPAIADTINQDKVMALTKLISIIACGNVDPTEFTAKSILLQARDLNDLEVIRAVAIASATPDNFCAGEARKLIILMPELFERGL